jgi:hypothetical protein
MLMSKKLKPGQPGTKRLVGEYGQRLMCVRYRYDAVQSKRFKTIELIIEESDWKPPLRSNDPVEVRIGLKERDLQARIKQVKGKWNASKQVWELPYGKVVELGLTKRLA